jgi:IQ calmodulin-binding motif
MKKLHLLTCMLATLSFGTVHLYAAAAEQKSESDDSLTPEDIQAYFQPQTTSTSQPSIEEIQPAGHAEQSRTPTPTRQKSDEADKLSSNYSSVVSLYESENNEEPQAFLTAERVPSVFANDCAASGLAASSSFCFDVDDAQQSSFREVHSRSITPVHNPSATPRAATCNDVIIQELHSPGEHQTISTKALLTEDQAATKIQAAFRRHKTRKALIPEPKFVPNEHATSHAASPRSNEWNSDFNEGNYDSDYRSFHLKYFENKNDSIELWENGEYVYNHVTKPICQTIAAPFYKGYDYAWKNLPAIDITQALKWKGLYPADLANVAKNFASAMIQKLNGIKIGRPSDLMKFSKGQEEAINEFGHDTTPTLTPSRNSIQELQAHIDNVKNQDRP